MSPLTKTELKHDECVFDYIRLRPGHRVKSPLRDGAREDLSRGGPIPVPQKPERDIYIYRAKEIAPLTAVVLLQFCRGSIQYKSELLLVEARSLAPI